MTPDIPEEFCDKANAMMLVIETLANVARKHPKDQVTWKMLDDKTTKLVQHLETCEICIEALVD